MADVETRHDFAGYRADWLPIPAWSREERCEGKDRLVVCVSVRVDGSAGVETAPSAMISEPPSCFFDQDRRGRVIPRVTREPDAKIQLARCDAHLVAPAVVLQRPARKLLENGASLGRERFPPRVMCETLGALGAFSRNVDRASIAEAAAGERPTAPRCPPALLACRTRDHTQHDLAVDFERQQGSPVARAGGVAARSIDAINDPPTTRGRIMSADLLAEQAVARTGLADGLQNGGFGGEIGRRHRGPVNLRRRWNASRVPSSERDGVRMIDKLERDRQV